MAHTLDILFTLYVLCLLRPMTCINIGSGSGIESLSAKNTEEKSSSSRVADVLCGTELTDYTGTIRYSSPENSSISADCEWTIVAQENEENFTTKGVFVAFSSFDLFFTDCLHVFPSDDNSSVANLTSTDDYSSYCGFHSSGTSFFSAANKLLLAFRDCSDWCFPGFQLLYTSDYACATPRRLQSDSGTFSSPFHPETYTRDLACSWYIYLASDWVLVLHFDYFDVGGADIDPCTAFYGYLNISGSQSGNLNYCNGKRPATTLQLRGANANVFFHLYSGDFIPAEGRGFKIAYNIVPQEFVTWPSSPSVFNREHLPSAYSGHSSRNGGRVLLAQSDFRRLRRQTWSTGFPERSSHTATVAAASCGGGVEQPVVLSNYSGTIESPNFPGNYPADSNCAWRVLPHSDSGIFLVFTVLDLHWSDCVHISPYSVSSPRQTDYYCGSSNETLTAYVQPDALIYFHACSGLSYPGFRIGYISDNACYGGGSGRLLPLPSGSFASPFYPGTYVRSVDCRWFVNVPAGQMLVLTFDLFKLDGPSSGSCSSDFASVRVTAGNISPTTFCSTQQPTKKLYLTGSVVVIFDAGKTDSADGSGFEASYIVDKENVLLCGSGIRLADGEFSYVGRLEIFYNGQWGTVCEDGFDSEDANVACNQLGFGYAGTVLGHAYGPGTGPIWLSKVVCAGRETCLGRCGHEEWGYAPNCTHGNDVSISCKLSECGGWGDPHYTSYDKKQFDYQGLCKYLLTAPISPDEALPEFQVLSKSFACGARVACNLYVEIVYDGDIFRIADKQTVNGITVALPYTSRNGTYTVRMVGSYARYETKFGLRVEKSGYTFSVAVPGSGTGRMTGLCGNCDGDPSNDITLKNGTFVGDKSNGPTLVGDSYVVFDSDFPLDTVCITPDPPPPCETYPPSVIEGCGHLKDANGVFARCIAAIGSEEANNNYENCLLDACYTGGSSICDSLKAFADRCTLIDIRFDCDTWRAATGCDVNQVQCPAGQIYRCNTSACQATCTDPFAADNCFEPNREGCVCPEFTEWFNGKCVAECPVGCIDDNQQFHPIGDQWPALFECTTLTCVFCVDCPLSGRIQTVPGCQDDEYCYNDQCARLTTTTITTPTTTVAPEVPSLSTTPYVGMTYNGTFTATEDISFDCQDNYNQDFRRNFDYVVSRVNDLIAQGQICTSGMRVASGTVTVSSIGTTGRVTFLTMVGINAPSYITVGQTESCAWQAGAFIQDFNNWRQPIISLIWGCPPTTFASLYDLKQAKWNCA